MPGWLSAPGRGGRLILSRPRSRAVAFATVGSGIPAAQRLALPLPLALPLGVCLAQPVAVR